MKHFLTAIGFVFGAMFFVIIGRFLGQSLADLIGLRESTSIFISGLGWGTFIGIVIWEIKNKG